MKPNFYFAVDDISNDEGIQTKRDLIPTNSEKPLNSNKDRFQGKHKIDIQESDDLTLIGLAADYVMPCPNGDGTFLVDKSCIYNCRNISRLELIPNGFETKCETKTECDDSHVNYELRNALKQVWKATRDQESKRRRKKRYNPQNEDFQVSEEYLQNQRDSENLPKEGKSLWQLYQAKRKFRESITPKCKKVKDCRKVRNFKPKRVSKQFCDQTCNDGIELKCETGGPRLQLDRSTVYRYHDFPYFGY